MKTILLLITAWFFAGNCTQNARSSHRISNLKFTGSTPGDSVIKSILRIPASDPVDFMRWELVLEDPGRSSFVLNINYGLSKPNSSGFEPGNTRVTIKGKYRADKSENFNGHVYDLISTGFNNDTLSLAILSDCVLHVLRSNNRLMVGNGGWSYTLTLTDLTHDEMTPLMTMAPVESILNDNSLKVIFDGRTPCSEIAMAFNLNPPPDCLKLKWRLTLSRDPVTLKPSTYELQRTDVRNSGAVTGKWTVFCLTDSAVVYKLDPDKPDKSISLLAGDENVLFFLDKNYRLFPGNSDFSYTLNRKDPV